MSLNVSGYNISDIYVGDDKIDSIFVGEDLVYSSGKPMIPLYFEVVDPTETATIGFERICYHINSTTIEGMSPSQLSPKTDSSILSHDTGSFSFEYSYDNATWQEYVAGTSISIGGNNPARVYFRGENVSWYNTWTDGSKITKTYGFSTHAITDGGDIFVGGDPASLHRGEYFGSEECIIANDYWFAMLFAECATLVDASKLEFHYLYRGSYGSNQYWYMFYHCANLQYPPELPETRMAYFGYQYMFAFCTRLREAPELPATSLSISCYSYMFVACHCLVNAPELPATILRQRCYEHMFDDCMALRYAPDMEFDTLELNSLTSMYHMCRSLTELPRITFRAYKGLCQNLFSGDSAYIPPGADGACRASLTSSADYPYSYRLPATGTAVDETSGSSGPDNIFNTVAYDRDGNAVTPPVNTTFYTTKPMRQ